MSNLGGLPEYQAPGLPILESTDQRGLVEALNQLADPDIATELGQVAQDSYLALNSKGEVTRELAAMLEHSIGQR